MARRHKRAKHDSQPLSEHTVLRQPAEPKDIYQAASQANEQDTEWPEYAERKINRRPLLIAGAAIIVLAILGGGGYILLKNRKSSPQPANSPTNSSQQNQPAPASSGSANGTQQYTATGSDLNLSFSYPSNWSTTPASGTDTTNQEITVSSPSTSIQSADGSNVTGKVVVTIRPGSANISELNSNNPIATQSSSQFAYTAPASDQHQYPYLTFIHFSNGSSVAGAFEEAMITGITPFTKGQAVTAASLSNLDPIIAASFYKCGDTACSGNGSGILSVTSSAWQNDEVFQQTQALFASLKLN